MLIAETTTPTAVMSMAEPPRIRAAAGTRPRRRKRADQFIADATGIEQGDLVVHQDHGIGRYDGLETIEVNGGQYMP